MVWRFTNNGRFCQSIQVGFSTTTGDFISGRNPEQQEERKLFKLGQGWKYTVYKRKEKNTVLQTPTRHSASCAGPGLHRRPAVERAAVLRDPRGVRLREPPRTRAVRRAKTAASTQHTETETGAHARADPLRHRGGCDRQALLCSGEHSGAF